MIDGVRGVFGSLFVGGIGVAAVVAGGTAGWAIGVVLIALALAGIIWIVRRS